VKTIKNTVRFRKNKPLSKALFEGLIFGGAYIRTGLSTEGNLPFLLCFALHLRAISKYKSPGGLIFGGAI